MLKQLPRFWNALRPNSRFWLIQWLFVPVMSLLGSLYVATEAHAGDFNLNYSDYVIQSNATNQVVNEPTIHTPITLAALASPVYKIHFSNYEFPTRWFAGNPSDPVKLTAFEAYLHEAVNNFEAMKMTPHVEEADYRVEIECAGILLCSRVQLNVYDMHRNFLASMQMPRLHLINSDANLKAEAEQIAEAVNKRVLAFPDGGYGNYNTNKPLTLPKF
jgi:hypothetical protein